MLWRLLTKGCLFGLKGDACMLRTASTNSKLQSEQDGIPLIDTNKWGARVKLEDVKEQFKAV